MHTHLRLSLPALYGALALPLIAGSPCRALAGEDEPEVPDPVEVCLSCHAVEPGGPVLEGPTLWGVVGRAVASVPGFDYSPALRALGGVWDRARLDRWLADPKAYAPGTLMDMGGVRNAADRKIVLDYLETLAPGKQVAKDD